MGFKIESLELHEKHMGKLEIVGTVPLDNATDLGLAYTPGIGAVCTEISKNVENAYKYTIKGKSIAIITNGTAILGLGDIGPEAGMPVIEGKALLLKKFGNVNAYPIALACKDPVEVVNTIKNISPGFGGIHLEDIKAPECFYIEDELKKILDIPVYHDDQHGTAVAVLAGLYNALKVVKKEISEVKIVICGAGASGIATAKLLLLAGFKNIILTDINGALVNGDLTLNSIQQEMARVTNLNHEKGSLEEVIKNKDIFIGLSVGNIVTEQMVQSMSKDSIIFALANPHPEIYPEFAVKGGAKIIGTGRSDFPNQINNVLAFPGIFKGVLKSRAKDITSEMLLEAALALSKLVKDEDLDEEHIVPNVFDKGVSEAVANAVTNVEYKNKVLCSESKKHTLGE